MNEKMSFYVLKSGELFHKSDRQKIQTCFYLKLDEFFELCFTCTFREVIMKTGNSLSVCCDEMSTYFLES